MSTQVPLDADNRADNPQQDDLRDDGTHEIAPDLAYKRLGMVNVVFYGLPGAGDRQWVLIDAGLPKTAHLIAGAAAERFGEKARPAAIVMTHAHSDHAGSLLELAEQWDVPVYAHELEKPYLNGTASYPPPDPTVGGGMMSVMSTLFPRGPFDVGPRLRILSAEGSLPSMPGWSWLPTPGHTPGHVSLWRETDRALIAGDAFITTNQESAYAVATQKAEMHGPPMYYTQNWEQARASVQRLAVLDPELAVTGHGRAMRGLEMRTALHRLVQDFDRVAVPEHGHYTEHPIARLSLLTAES